MRISDWSSDVCSSDLLPGRLGVVEGLAGLDRLDHLEHLDCLDVFLGPLVGALHVEEDEQGPQCRGDCREDEEDLPTLHDTFFELRAGKQPCDAFARCSHLQVEPCETDRNRVVSGTTI